MSGGRVHLRIEWMDNERPWERHSEARDWPVAPNAGDYIDIPIPTGGVEARRVETVMWNLDGVAVVRMKDHPR